MRQSRTKAIILALACLVFLSQSIPARADSFIQFVQPFAITFDRSNQIIAWLDGHPDFDAIEAFIQNRQDQQPLIRVIITYHDGTQVDQINDEQVAAERALTFGRRTIYTPMEYSESFQYGIPSVNLKFNSFEGEAIVWNFKALFPCTTSQGGLTDPGNHSSDASLPVMYRRAGTVSGMATTLTFDGQPATIKAGPFPGSLMAYYTTDFLIGVIRASHLELKSISAPHHLKPGESWVYQDQYGRAVEYRILEVNCGKVVIQKTTGQEEIITAKFGMGRLEVASIRATGKKAVPGVIPPDPQGFVLEFDDKGQFSLSIDEQKGLVTGKANAWFQIWPIALGFTLTPDQPSWATGRIVDAVMSRHGRTLVIENKIGQ